MGDRIYLLIKEVKEPKKLDSGRTYVDIMVESDGKTLRYTAWDDKLFAFLIKNNTIDAEIVSKESEKKDSEGRPYINRKIANIYIDGKPVLTAPARGNFQREDPDEKRRSMALAYTKDLVVVGKIPLNEADITKWATFFGNQIKNGKF